MERWGYTYAGVNFEPKPDGGVGLDLEWMRQAGLQGWEAVCYIPKGIQAPGGYILMKSRLPDA